MHTFGKVGRDGKGVRIRLGEDNRLVVGMMMRKCKGNAQFKSAYRTAKIEFEDDNPEYNRPGVCAAQVALALTYVHGAVPIAMSEKWYHPSGDSMETPIRYYDEELGREVTDRIFGHGESVPPCESCSLLVPFLACNEGNCQIERMTGCGECEKNEG